MVGSKCILVILDGWGIGKGDQTDAIANANTSFMDSLCSGKLVAKLRTDGENVGLPEGQMGNSEVGHLNIGAGRVVYQDLVRINRAIADGSFYENPVLQEAIAQVKSTKGKLHFVGLASEGGVHSHQAHLVALCKAAASQGISPNIHLISDGRDADPKSGKNYWKKLQLDLKGLSVKVCSLVGRYYAMDRDQRWERIKLAYDLYTAGKGEKLESAEEAFDFFYQQDISDEFIKPVKLPDFQPIEPGDTVLFFNFRTDRCRQMVRVLSQESFPEFEMKPLDINLYTFTRYDSNFKNVGVLFEKDDLANTLGEVLAKAGKSQMRMAETEKYPHVSFFFSGGREKIFE
ncbi:MAG: 2,3-bisphosphoglycerate-independent phosphoglycerate mutase, partial [Luteibaculum sp.]